MNKTIMMLTLALLASLVGCGKKNPADEAAQDVKAMDQRAHVQDALKQAEESQNKAREAADKAGEEVK